MKTVQRAMASPWRKSTFLLIFTFFTLSLSGQKSIIYSDDAGIEIQVSMQEVEYEIGFDLDRAIASKKNEDYFKFYNTELTTLIVDKQTGKAILSLEKRMKPTWSTADWNIYLKSIHLKALNHQK